MIKAKINNIEFECSVSEFAELVQKLNFPYDTPVKYLNPYTPNTGSGDWTYFGPTITCSVANKPADPEEIVAAVKRGLKTMGIQGA